MEIFAGNYEWLMIDASHCKVHPHVARAKGRGQSGHEPHKGGLNTKSHLTVDSHDMPTRTIITKSTTKV